MYEVYERGLLQSVAYTMARFSPIAEVGTLIEALKELEGLRNFGLDGFIVKDGELIDA